MCVTPEIADFAFDGDMHPFGEQASPGEQRDQPEARLLSTFSVGGRLRYTGLSAVDPFDGRPHREGPAE